MTARNSRGGPLTTDRPTAYPRRKLSIRPTPPHPPTEDPVDVWAHGYFVVGHRGRCGLVMIVPACVFCGQRHQHGGKPDAMTVKRTASSHRGRYVVHLGAIEGRVAA